MERHKPAGLPKIILKGVGLAMYNIHMHAFFKKKTKLKKNT